MPIFWLGSLGNLAPAALILLSRSGHIRTLRAGRADRHLVILALMFLATTTRLELLVLALVESWRVV